MITTKRPGFGIAPKHLALVLGRPLKIDVEEDEILTLGHGLSEPIVIVADGGARRSASATWRAAPRSPPA